MPDRPFAFERLDVWQQAREFAVAVYEETDKFPREEQFGLVSQLRRAAISVPSNLAEGSARLSFKEQARFSEIAYGSLMEAMCQIMVSNDLGFLQEDALNHLRAETHQLSSRIQALRDSQIRRSKSRGSSSH